MAFEIREPMAQRLGLTVAEVSSDGMVTLAENRQEFCNRYGIAHGGFLHTLAHVTALLSCQQSLGGRWQLRDASCQFLRALRQFPAKTRVRRLGGSDDAPVYTGEVYDAKGSLCFVQSMALQRAPEHEGAPYTHTPIILSASPMPADLEVEPPFPCLSTSFSRYLNCYSIRRQGTGLVYALDLNEVNCDENGVAHPAAMFTVADSAVGGSLVRLEKKSPITVSASIRYLAPATRGLVAAIPRLTRGGRILYYYDVDIVDGTGTLAAVAQFVIQNLEHN